MSKELSIKETRKGEENLHPGKKDREEINKFIQMGCCSILYIYNRSKTMEPAGKS
jgi:hypothetical protein